MLEVYNRDTTPLTADQLCAQLEIICKASQQADEEPVGILTTQHRDSWGEVFTRLIRGELHHAGLQCVEEVAASTLQTQVSLFGNISVDEDTFEVAHLISASRMTFQARVSITSMFHWPLMRERHHFRPDNKKLSRTVLKSNVAEMVNRNLCVFFPDDRNKESVCAIQRSIFTLCLDGPMPKVAEEMYQSCAAVQMLHGGGSQWNSCNRWFDKTLQVKHTHSSPLATIFVHC